MTQSRKKFGAIIAVAFVAVLSLGLFGCSSSPTYTAGTYEGIGQGIGGDVVVSVTFSDDAIESVEVTENNETDGIGSNAIDQLPGEIVETQSLAIDGVSGATMTSTAIIDAVSDCVEQAGGDLDALTASE